MLSGVSEQLGRKAPEIGPERAKRSGYAGSLIQDGDTLQIGVGSAAECLAQNGNLNNKTDWVGIPKPRRAASSRWCGMGSLPANSRPSIPVNS